MELWAAWWGHRSNHGDVYDITEQAQQIVWVWQRQHGLQVPAEPMFEFTTVYCSQIWKPQKWQHITESQKCDNMTLELFRPSWDSSGAKLSPSNYGIPWKMNIFHFCDFHRNPQKKVGIRFVTWVGTLTMDYGGLKPQTYVWGWYHRGNRYCKVV